MEDLHEGANILLAHWHYYRTDEDPLEVDVIDKHRSRLQDLGAEQFTFVKKSCRVMREKSKCPPPPPPLPPPCQHGVVAVLLRLRLLPLGGAGWERRTNWRRGGV